MAILKIIDENRKLTDRGLIRDYLMACGIRYEYWKPEHAVEANAPAEEILKAYAKEIEKLKASGGYVTADVIAVNAQTPGLDSMLAKFNREHWHDEDEVRFIVQGHGLFPGWTPYYTESGIDRNFQPICFGPSYISPQL